MVELSPSPAGGLDLICRARGAPSDIAKPSSLSLPLLPLACPRYTGDTKGAPAPLVSGFPVSRSRLDGGQISNAIL